AVSEQHEVARSELRQLAGQLAPDGAACARDQHRSAGHDGAHRCEVGADGLAAEQVLNLHLAQVRQADAARQDREQGRDRAGAATTTTVRNESRTTTEIGTRRCVRSLVGSTNSPSVAQATAEVAVAWMIFAMSWTPAWRHSRLYIPKGRNSASFRSREREA